MSKEIKAAKKSLAATEEQLNLDGTLLRMALELAGDVAEVYREAPKHLKRDLNQAFFKKLKIKPEWDEERDELAVRVVDADLTEPYAVFLADDFAAKALTEAEQIRSAAPNAEDDPSGAVFLRSVFDLAAYGGEGGI